MTNFKINFLLSPWILLLIIPAAALTVFLYCRLNKRFRKSPNRIVSTVLHSLVMLLCICVLAGVTFAFDTANPDNELVILVDASFSTGNAKDRVDRYVYDVLQANNRRTKVAIVTFGFDQKVVVKMGNHSPTRAFNTYMSASEPDISATDISAALSFVWDPVTATSGADTGRALIRHPENAKIILISDGLQTDQDAKSLAKRISMDGIQIDTTFFAGAFMDDIRIVGVSYPNRTLAVGEEFEFELTVISSYNDNVTIWLTDEAGSETYTRDYREVSIEPGTQKIRVPYSYQATGHHELKFVLDSAVDSQAENNIYFSYYDMGESVKILLVEKYKGESDALSKVLREEKSEEELQLKTVLIGDTGNLPSTVDEMTEYDEIVLVNIAHKDMPEGFEENLYEYVYIRGGGLYTVGGYQRDSKGQIIYEDKDGELVPQAHSYVEEDMEGTLYQRMLPVDAADYMPPVALVIIIERSSAMSAATGGGSKLDTAIRGASAVLDVLSEDDYVSVIKLEDSYSGALSFTPVTQKDSILSSIRAIANQEIGGTNYTAAFRQACSGLSKFTEAERKHILLITDGNPTDSYNSYGELLERYHESDDISISVVTVDTEVSTDLRILARYTEGGAHKIAGGEIDTLPDVVKEDLAFDNIAGAVAMKYSPKIRDITSVVDDISQEELDRIVMQGFFSTRLKGAGSVYAPLYAKNAPLYAQWTFGRGKVGSFMCDLFGVWSAQFLDSGKIGVPLINRMVSELTPSVDIRMQSFDAVFVEDNFRTQVSILDFNGREDTGHKLVAFVKSPAGADSSAELQKFDLSALSPGGNRFSFENLATGVHEVVILKVSRSFDIFQEDITDYRDIAGPEIAGIFKTYRIFSYSKEYDPSEDAFTVGKELLIEISTRETEETEEKLVYDPELIFEAFEIIHREYDPRILFIILALVLFLTDITIRLFKFKRPRFRLRKL